MQLGNFTEREVIQGDKLSAKENVDKPMVVLVREHRTGIKTRHNQDPNEPGRYKPEGGEGVHVDVGMVATNEVFVDVLWMGGAIVDSLSPYVGQAVPVKLYWKPSDKGGNPYISVRPLDGNELLLAQQWAAANPMRFDAERQQRAAQAAAQPAVQVPGAPATPPSWAVPPAAPAPTPAPAVVPGPIAATPAQVAQQWAPVAPAQQAAPATPPPAPAPAAAVANINDPAVQALLAQIAGGQVPPPA